MLHMYYYINNNIIIWQMQHMIKKKNSTGMGIQTWFYSTKMNQEN